MKFYGNHHEPHVKRIFEFILDEEGGYKHSKEFDFEEWAIMIWSFCTLSKAQLAQVAFEVFGDDTIDKIDVDTIHTLYHGPKSFFKKKYNPPYTINDDGTSTITKATFIKFCSGNDYLIHPAIKYQRKMRKLTGGMALWISLSMIREIRFGNLQGQVSKNDNF